MFKIFSALRVLVARFGESLGSFAISAIEDDFIPELEKRLSREKDEDKVGELTRQIAEWRRFSRGDKSDTWDVIARSTVSHMVRKFVLPYDAAEDIEQNLSLSFFTDPDSRDIFRKFDISDGPVGLTKRWKAVLNNKVFNATRAYKNTTLEHKLGPRQHDREEDARPVIENIMAPKEFSSLDRMMMREIKGDLDTYIAQKYAHNVALVLCYERWMELAERRGPENISFARDIEPLVITELKKRGLPHSHGTVGNAKQAMNKAIIEFFEFELEYPLTKKTKERLKVAERVACMEFRCRLAAWVLGR
jgi:hypothetical protein